MLITRGFGTCSGGSGPGDPTYVPITDPVVLTDNIGKSNMQSSVNKPSISSRDALLPPKISIDTSINNLH